MEDLELASPEDLVRRFAPDIVPQLNDDRFSIHAVGFLGSLIRTMVVISTFGVFGPMVFVVLGGSFLTGGGVAEFYSRLRHRTQLAKFNRDLAASPWILYEAVAKKFLEEIERQRARTLGPESDLGQARRPLEAAAHESARSLAYWQQRCIMDRENEVARQQCETARRLHDKFQAALAQLDSRAQVLVTFFNECEARLSVLHYAKRD